MVWGTGRSSHGPPITKSASRPSTNLFLTATRACSAHANTHPLLESHGALLRCSTLHHVQINCLNRTGSLLLCTTPKAGKVGQKDTGFVAERVDGIPGTYVIRHTSYVIRHTPYAIRHAPYVIRHTPYAIRHTPYALRHTPYVIRHTPYAIRHHAAEDDRVRFLHAR